MKVLRITLVLFLVFAAQVAARQVSADEQLGSDNMGNGAEYDNSDNRSLEIDQYGDGNYNSGEGSVMNDAGPDSGADSGSDSGADSGSDNGSDLASDVGSDY
jgi:hypothetical protein